VRLVPGCLLLGILVLTAANRETTVEREREPTYDPSTVIRISGTIQDVRETTTTATLNGIHVMLKDRRVIEVYLGPAAFLKTFSMKFAKGDDIQVTGSKVRFAGADLLLARQVRKDNDILVLRDENGKPYWDDEIFKASALVLNQGRDRRCARRRARNQHGFAWRPLDRG